MIFVQIENYEGDRRGELQIMDGDHLTFTVTDPTRVKDALEALRNLARALGSSYRFSLEGEPCSTARNGS